jgi:hypothetical protein
MGIVLHPAERRDMERGIAVAPGGQRRGTLRGSAARHVDLAW